MQRVQTEEVKAVLPALDVRSLTVLALVEDGVQRFHFQTVIASSKTIFFYAES